MLLLIFVVWVILNGNITTEILLFGVALTGLLYLFLRYFMAYSLKKEARIYRCVGLGLAYVATLLWEILKANFTVMHIVLNKKRPVHPALVFVQVPLKTDLGRVLLANAITLTPGTITVDASTDLFCVHCLSREMIEGIETSRFVRILKKLEAK